MKIYESLTQSKTPQTQPTGNQNGENGPPQYYPHQQQPPQHIYQQPQSNQYYPPAQQNAFAPPPQYGYIAQHAQSDYGDAVPVHTASGRSLRKRSSDGAFEGDRSSDESSSRSRKKKKADGRWSKRFTWPDDLHRDFVAAIFDVGLKHASPSAILEYMPEHDQITSERVKSHLQKYRLHRSKSKQEFMSSYEASLNNYHSTGIKTKSLSAGEVAAHLTYSTMTETEEPPVPLEGQQEPYQDSPDQMEATSARSGFLELPKLTEAEKRSPIGASMGYMMGLFFSLRQQLMASRAAAGVDTSEAQDPSSLPGVPFIFYPNSTDTEPVVSYDGQLHESVAVLPHNPSMDASYQQDQSSAASAGAPASSAALTTRTTLEESHLMKREMQNQMAFQNKMRALKQQELNKFEKHGTDGQTDVGDGAPQTEVHVRRKSAEEANDGGVVDDNDERFQETGEAAEAGNNNPDIAVKLRHRGQSMGGTDEFWAHDEQLFEFLMNS
jgi:SHAQKYF class myb-like DNA-binding protein